MKQGDNCPLCLEVLGAMRNKLLGPGQSILVDVGLLSPRHRNATKTLDCCIEGIDKHVAAAVVTACVDGLCGRVLVASLLCDEM